jgi:hypothetical protein
MSPSASSGPIRPLLTVNLVLPAVGYFRFISGRSRYQTVIDWRLRHLPAQAVRAAFVALAFPPLFGFA